MYIFYHTHTHTHNQIIQRNILTIPKEIKRLQKWNFKSTALNAKSLPTTKMCTGRTVCSSYRKRSGLHHQWLSWTAVVQIVVKIAQSKLDHVKCGQRKKKKDNEHKIYKENPFSRSTKNPGWGAWKIKTTHRSPKIIHRMPRYKIRYS